MIIFSRRMWQQSREKPLYQHEAGKRSSKRTSNALFRHVMTTASALPPEHTEKIDS